RWGCGGWGPGGWGRVWVWWPGKPPRSNPASNSFGFIALLPRGSPLRDAVPTMLSYFHGRGKPGRSQLEGEELARRAEAVARLDPEDVRSRGHQRAHPLHRVGVDGHDDPQSRRAQQHLAVPPLVPVAPEVAGEGGIRLGRGLSGGHGGEGGEEQERRALGVGERHGVFRI